MPLKPGKSEKVIGKNIEELHKANANKIEKRPDKQIVAIALESARRTAGGKKK